MKINTSDIKVEGLDIREMLPPDQIMGSDVSIARFDRDVKAKLSATIIGEFLLVRGSLETILSEPHSGKALKDELAGLRSFRVSRFRIIYRLSKRKDIEVVAIGPRQRIYEETFNIISKEEKQP